MNIAMLSNLYAPLGTGSAIQSSGLARELVKRGHHVVVFTAKVMKDMKDHEITPDGVEIFRLSCLKLPRLPISMNFPWLNATFLPRNIRFMKRIIKEHNIEVLHVHNHMFDMALNGVLLSRLLKIPVTVTIHTVILHTRRIYNMLLCPIDRYFLGSTVIRRAKAIICPDCTVQKYLQKRFHRHDGNIIPYGIELPPPPADKKVAELRDKWNLTGKRVILSLGHMHALRNRQDLVKAFARLVDKYSDIRLVIVGSRSYQPTEDLVKKLNLEDYIIFTGPQPHDLIPAFHSMAECEAGWLDQNNMASVGVACLEGMYYGNPVIVSCPEDTHEANGLKNGENIILLEAPVKIDDVHVALEHLLEDSSCAKEMGKKAAEFTHSYFNWENVANKHVNLYKEMTEKS